MEITIKLLNNNGESISIIRKFNDKDQHAFIIKQIKEMSCLILAESIYSKESQDAVKDYANNLFLIS